ncbi:MAG: hypothetical protein IBJ03_15930 [Gemmatimonadaceae bacterium]|nr:hypothetical protein [Gemmatimonadaceae bacterium]
MLLIVANAGGAQSTGSIKSPIALPTTTLPRPSVPSEYISQVLSTSPLSDLYSSLGVTAKPEATVGSAIELSRAIGTYIPNMQNPGQAPLSITDSVVWTRVRTAYASLDSSSARRLADALIAVQRRVNEFLQVAAADSSLAPYIAPMMETLLYETIVVEAAVRFGKREDFLELLEDLEDQVQSTVSQRQRKAIALKRFMEEMALRRRNR